MACCSRVTAAIIASFLLAFAMMPFLIFALLSDHSSANMVDHEENPNHELGGAHFRIYYTRSQYCHYSCFYTSTKTLFEEILNSTGCQGYYSGQDAALAFAGLGAIAVGVLWFLFIAILCFETHRSLMLRRVVKLVYAVTWVFLLISFFITIGLSFSIKCSSWDGPLSDRFNSKADNLIQYGVSLAWLFLSTIVWACNERAVVGQSEEAVRSRTVNLGDPDGVFTSRPVPMKSVEDGTQHTMPTDDATTNGRREPESHDPIS